MRIPLGSKFGLIALPECSAWLSEPIWLGPGLGLTPNPPVDVSATWSKWLGSLRSEEVATAPLFILSTMPSERPDILDGENKELERRAYQFLWAMLLVGVPHYGAAYLLSGGNDEGTPGVRMFHALPRYRWSPGATPHQFRETDFRNAYTLHTALDPILRSSGIRRYERLRRGIVAFFGALEAHYADDRIHQFVRALEAVVKPLIGKTKRQFVHRCQTFTGASDHASKALENMFALRSRAEHLQPWDDVLDGYSMSEKQRSLERRIRQAEALARHVYTRILSTPSLHRHFEDDASIDAFWNLDDGSRRSLWGSILDIRHIT